MTAARPRWAGSARPGDALALVGPDAGYGGVHGGIEFKPPPDAPALLFAGDETAVPAITSILERLPADVRGEALLEVPTPGDALDVKAPPGLGVTWLPRAGADHGRLLFPALEAAADRQGRALYVWIAGEAGVVKILRRHLVTARGMDRRSVTFMGYWRRGG